jgi:hypothetical protein
MALIVNFPLPAMSEKDKKIVRLESYIKSNLIELAKVRRDVLVELKNARNTRLRLVQNEKADPTTDF